MNADQVVVWGNCQAGPLADLLTAPLAGHGLQVTPVPPVYLCDTADVRRVHELVRRSAVLVTQPVGDDYREAGCGARTLEALLPAGSRVVRWPVVYHVGPFPTQVRGYDGDGGRVDAPLTDYHDLRVVLAASRGHDRVDGRPLPADRVAAVATASRDELRRRESGLDVAVSDLVDAPDALWTMTHPSNRFLAQVAERVLDRLGIAEPVSPPSREYLGQRRAPVEGGRDRWVIDGREVPPAEVAAAHLAFYAERPDVVTATLRRAAERLRILHW